MHLSAINNKQDKTVTQNRLRQNKSSNQTYSSVMNKIAQPQNVLIVSWEITDGQTCREIIEVTVSSYTLFDVINVSNYTDLDVLYILNCKQLLSISLQTYRELHTILLVFTSLYLGLIINLPI